MDGDDLTTPEQRAALSKAERKGRKKVEQTSRQLEKLVIEYVTPDSIKPNPWNPNRQSEHDFELLCRSMEDDGFTQPVVCARLTEADFEDMIDEETGDPIPSKIKECGYLEVGDILIVDGEHRWRAGTKLDFSEIPITVTPMRAAQAMIATLRHNRARGSEDIGLAGEVLRDLQALGATDLALDSLMMDEDEFNRLMQIADETAAEVLADEEHGASWEPDRSVNPDGEDITEAATTGEAPSGSWTRAGSAAAVAAVRDRETRLAAAKTEEQRAMVRKDSDKTFHRVSLIFAGEEGELVNDVLGGAPAQALVQLCADKKGVETALKLEGWVAIDSVIGQRMIPAEAARVLAEAKAKMEADGTITKKNAFQVIEYLAAEFLAGA